MKLKVLELRPTQFAVGMKEVLSRAEKIRALKSKKLDDYLQERLVPVVLGLKKRVYLVDRHHHARACWEAGVDFVHAEMKADLSDSNVPAFWKAMESKRWVHAYDQFGLGPRDPLLLPEDIRGLADDPYRSLAWEVRRAGGYAKTNILFSDFLWADFFRKTIKPAVVYESYDTAVSEALKWAASPQASRLPGALRPKD